MRFISVFHSGALVAAACLCMQAQQARSIEQPAEAKGIPPRAAPTEYLTQAQAGTATVAAEFKGHSIPTAQGTLTSADYVVVEVALFGPPGARAQLSFSDFSLRINGRKAPYASQPYGLVLASVKDPEWEPPNATPAKQKTSMVGSGGGDRGNEPPAPVKVPVDVQRGWAKRVQQWALPEGDRALPQAGLIFFEYRGKGTGIRTIELTYAGSAGNVTMNLEP
jgi:hypothetical protein